MNLELHKIVPISVFDLCPHERVVKIRHLAFRVCAIGKQVHDLIFARVYGSDEILVIERLGVNDTMPSKIKVLQTLIFLLPFNDVGVVARTHNSDFSLAVEDFNEDRVGC